MHLGLNKKGFTLIELLIVVAIIGILAAVGATVIPNLLLKTKVTVVTKQINDVADFVQTVMTNCHVTGGSMNLYVPPGWGWPLTNPGHCTKSTIDQKGSGLKNHIDDQWDFRNVYESKKHTALVSAIGNTPSQGYIHFYNLKDSNNKDYFLIVGNLGDHLPKSERYYQRIVYAE